MALAYDVLVVGTGHGGAQAAAKLRQLGFAGTIGVIGDESDAPYQRPPLSKDYLKRQTPLETFLIRPAEFWANNRITLHLSRTVVAVDPESHRLQTGDGEWFGYGKLVWAAGGSARRLRCEGEALAGVHAIRSRADVDRLRLALESASRIVIVGGGYIGLESAASLSSLGKQVVVLEAQDRVLARVAGEPLSRFYEAEHRAHGIEIRLSIGVEGILGDDGRVTGVRLADGAVLAADIVIVAIGIVPAGQLLAAAGAVVGDGIHVDSQCRTSLEDVYAIGDCAAHQNCFADGARIRLESVQNATDQAIVVANDIVGRTQLYTALPWFWSDQFDLRLQTAGLSRGHDALVIRGEPRSRSFSIVYLRHGKTIAFDCVNAPRDFAQGRTLVQQGCTPNPQALADATTPLKSLL